MIETSPHKFHIPVMGLAYTIDSPVKVAHFGINSTISIIEDNLVEMMRKYYSEQFGEIYKAISSKETDFRARRITEYLNLVQRIVAIKLKKLKKSSFQKGSEIYQYFEMLPDDNLWAKAFKMLKISDDNLSKENLEKFLKDAVIPGAIEVNIMTKTDNDHYNKNGKPIEDGSDAVSALRGYAKSELSNSAVVFSAGMNPRLYNYLENFTAFDPEDSGYFNKKIIIKVSDYRSALIQGKYLAKKGIWVSEFRIESGLNCGGHAFATDGFLLGPILEQFKNKKTELIYSLFELYEPAIKAKNKIQFKEPHPIKITVQGGIGTFEEDNFLHNYYGIESTGWGTPFLLCPEATTVDDETLKLLCNSEEGDVILSKISPLGVPFNYLKGGSGEIEKLQRISRGAPGSPCTEKYLESNTEFTEKPICTASIKYQKLKLEQLKTLELSVNEFEKQADEVLSKECLCIGLSNSAAIKYEQEFVKNLRAVTICPGPNIVNFTKTVTLREMCDHIYGRANIMNQPNRPHMFIKELQLYVSYLKNRISETSEIDKKFEKYIKKFSGNLIEGINYYRKLINDNHCHFPNENVAEDLDLAEKEIESLGFFTHELSSMS